MIPDREKLAREMDEAVRISWAGAGRVESVERAIAVAEAYADRRVAEAVSLIEDLIIEKPDTEFREGYNEALLDAAGNIKLALSSTKGEGE